jgi:hypothetical protein
MFVHLSRTIRDCLLRLILAIRNLKLISMQYHSHLNRLGMTKKEGTDNMVRRRWKWGIPIVSIVLVYASALYAQTQENPTEDQMRNFLLHAKVVESKQGGKGVTSPYRLTLKQGTMVHDGSFQSIDEYKPLKQFDNGKTEANFRDSFKYNIAAFELAVMLGLGDMMPVTVERKWEGKIGSLSWWLPVVMDEGKRLSKHIEPPDLNAWNKQMSKMLVFAQLVYDTDRNAGNMLISEDWHLWMIDFSRAFRLMTSLENKNNLQMCDRQLLQKLRQLDAAEVERKTKRWLTKEEINGVIARRDRIVAIFDDLIAKKGEKAVLYD